MNLYNYSVSTTIIWTSFDSGQVKAENREEAKKLAAEELKENFQKANDALAFADNTKGFSLEFNPDCIEINIIASNI